MYEELIFELGDLAREHLADAKRAPAEMESVFAAEDEVLAIREATAALEDDLNEEDANWNEFLNAWEVEQIEQKAIIARWRSAVVGVEERSRSLKKKISALKAALRYKRESINRAAAAFQDLEQREAHEHKKVAVAKENLKNARLHLMRDQRTVEEFEWELNQVLTPKSGQPGAAGILAHKRILEMEDEHEEREHRHQARMKELEALIVEQEENEKEAEAELDGALFALGEACYSSRFSHPKLSALYGRLDKVK